MPDHPDRLFNLASIPNARDLGGYIGHGGRPVKWGKLIRTARLTAMNDADRKRLEGLPVARIVDLRTDYERDLNGMDWSGPGAPDYTHAPIGNERVEEIKAVGKKLHGGEFSEPEIIAYFKGSYPRLIKHGAGAFKTVFDAALDVPSDKALLFHCTSGKDRTGIAAILLLWSLGVDMETITADFLLTNKAPLVRERSARQAKVQSEKLGTSLPDDRYVEIYGVGPDHIGYFHETVEGEFGGIGPYLSGHVGVDDAMIDALRAKFLE